MNSVSVIMPVYNAAATIAEALRSALGQTLPPLEVLVVDDGSQDATAEIAAGFGNIVRLIRQQNGGPATARNRAAAEAKGAWLALLDADDFWAPTKLERQLALPVNDQVAVIHCASNTSPPGVPAAAAFNDMWKRNWIINSSALVRRDVWRGVGGMDPALRNTEDYHLWLRLAAMGWHFAYLPEELVYYRRGPGLSSDPEKVLAGAEENLRRLQAEFGLPQDQVAQRNMLNLEAAWEAALHSRRLSFARRTARRLVAEAPTPNHLAGLLVSYAPRPVLDLRRRLVEALASAHVSPSALAGVSAPARFDFDDRPRLVVTIDTEEEFDWRTVPFRPLGVSNIAAQWRAHRVFDKHGVVPTYLVDHCVVADPKIAEPLAALLAEGRCEIGAHLHPWVTPPRLEEPDRANSYAGNLPPLLEREKIRHLTQRIEAVFGQRPVVYRGGRYGSGAATPHILRELGYLVDTTVLPFNDLRWDDGPNYWGCPAQPYWTQAEPELLEVPLTVGVVGVLAQWAPAATFSRLSERAGIRLLASRARLADRIRLTPEGITLREAKQLTLDIVRRGGRVFNLTYHSSSIDPGNTAYVRNEQDLENFLRWLDDYIVFFKEELNGVWTTPSALYKAAKRSSQRGAPETAFDCASADAAARFVMPADMASGA